MDYARKIALYQNLPQHRTKLKKIDIFIDANRVNSSNCDAVTLKFSVKFNHSFFQHAFIFINMFPESHGFVDMPVESCFKDTCSNLSLSNYSEKRLHCSTL